VFRAFWFFNRSNEAAEFAMDFLQLPFAGTRLEQEQHDGSSTSTSASTSASPSASIATDTFGGIYALIFAFVDWSPFRLPDLQRTEALLLSSGRMRLRPGTSLMHEIKRLQRDHSEHLDAIIQVMQIYQVPCVLACVLGPL
jgi:hypothetical protein